MPLIPDGCRKVFPLDSWSETYVLHTDLINLP